MDSNFLEVKDLEKNKINYLTLTFDLERQGQTHFYMTVCYLWLYSHDTDLIIGVDWLTNSRSVISNKPKLIT